MKKIQKWIVTAMMLLWILPLHADAAEALIPGGQVVGLELGNGTVTVAAFEDGLGSAAREAGLEVGDEILAIDDTAVATAQDVRRALEHSGGTVKVQVRREGMVQSLRLSPEITPEGPRLGVYLRQGITGIGTITYYDPVHQRFGALGHGVNDSSGVLATMTQGNIYPATVLSVKKGQVGDPGQLLGAAESNQPCGKLSGNTAQGVFGVAPMGWGGQPLPVGSAEDVHTGSATIRSTVSGNSIREYSVEVLKIYPKARQNGRNLLIRVTDPELLQATGGIVQGMSGSPILQDGKIIGAVTHVLVNDPTTGYGIFIENMLAAAA